MSSEIVLSLERAHVLGLALWGGASVLLGAGMVAYLIVQRVHARLLRHFAAQTAAWGMAELVLAALWWRGLAARDYAGAARLLALVRLALVAELGCIAIGATLVLGGWRILRSPGALGAGLGIIVQAAALLLLDGVLLRRLVLGG